MNFKNWIIFILLLCPPLALADEEDLWKRFENRSQISWQNLNLYNWFSIDQWLASRSQQFLLKELEQNKLEKRELMGRVISCVGVCRIYRGEGYTLARYRSSLFEGDDVVNYENSYLWIFLIDGTLLRLAPHSSLSLKEVALATKQTFWHLRLNQGHMHWQVRDTRKLKETSLAETDPIFLPLHLLEANAVVNASAVPVNELQPKIYEQDLVKDHTHSLNSILEQNNQVLADRQSILFLVTPNVSIQSDQQSGIFFVEGFGPSYWKLIDQKEQYEGDLQLVKSIGDKAFYRGHNNTEEFSLDVGKWYQASEDGRNISSFDQFNRDFFISEFFVKRIPSIMIAREYFIQRYAKKTFEKSENGIPLVELAGYELWQDFGIAQPVDGLLLDKRIQFLKEFTRRLETTHLASLQTLKHNYTKAGELEKVQINYAQFYSRAWDRYLSEVGQSTHRQFDPLLLQDRVRKMIWLKRNAKGRR